MQSGAILTLYITGMITTVTVQSDRETTLKAGTKQEKIRDTRNVDGKKEKNKNGKSKDESMKQQNDAGKSSMNTKK